VKVMLILTTPLAPVSVSYQGQTSADFPDDGGRGMDRGIGELIRWGCTIALFFGD
jgi:hypothetical protein